MANVNQRKELEKRIIEAEDKVNTLFSDLSWLDSQELFELDKAWWALADYYGSNNDDAVIEIEMLRSYVEFTRLFRRVAFEMEATDEEREKAKEWLGGFEGILEEIIRDVVSYKNRDEPKFGEL